MQVIGQLYAPAGLPLGKELQLRIALEAGWASGQITLAEKLHLTVGVI
jgi:hypothetical protein